MWLFQMFYVCAATLLCCLVLPVCGSTAITTGLRELYVKPTGGTCPRDPCHTLDEYAQNASQYFVSNTTFKFLSGHHYLNQSINVSDVVNLSLVAVNGTVNVTGSYSSLKFTAIANLTLEGFNIYLENLVMEDIFNLRFVGIDINNDCYPRKHPKSRGVTAINVLGTSVISGLSLSNKAFFIIRYMDTTIWLPPLSNILTIIDSSVYVIMSCDLSSEMWLHLYQSSYGVNLLIDNVNVSSYNVGLDIESITASNITMMNVHFSGVELEIYDSVRNSNTSVYISHCNFSTSSIRAATAKLTFETSIITESPVQLFPFKPTFFASVTFVECVFYENTFSLEYMQLPGIMTLLHANATFTNCTFTENVGTPIVAIDSEITLSGSNVFRNNRARRGGAIALYGNSYVIFTNGSDIQFVNNSADLVGGAIFVDNGQITVFDCFFKLEGQYNSHLFPHCYSNIEVNLSFSNNTAGLGGERIYGAYLDTCDVLDSECKGWQFTNILFHVNLTNNSELSAIASDPARVCLCNDDGRPDCTKVFINQEHYPGESFRISAVVVGDRFGTVNGSVYANLLPVNGSAGEVAELSENYQHSQTVGHLSCTDLTYTVFSNSSMVTLVLTAIKIPTTAYPSQDTVKEVNHDIQFYREYGWIRSLFSAFILFINITLISCPLGFGEPPRCECDPQLPKHGIHCNTTTQTFQRNGTVWINASFSGNTSDGVIFILHCPYGYCRSDSVDVNLNHPDTQCNFNHSGILCGGCLSGLSLALGSDQCLQCSNDYLALIIPFALAGVVLILFMKFLNLTVAQGMLNGLIFYANIVCANQAVWLPRQHTSIALTVFIAWLNLDLGIETCFFDGLDAYWKTWLQFVFPVYIWSIVILIIFLSRHSYYVSKFFGNNSVPILATLFLLSFSKLLRTTISVLQFSILHYTNDSTAAVWSFNGNVSYFDMKRVFLILMALMIIALGLIYTGVLLFAQCLQASNLRVAKLLVKLKPFLDAYFGPLKDKHRYWVGLLLLVRVIVFITFTVTSDESYVDLITTAAVSVVLLMYPTDGRYRSSYLNLLENSFLVNLCFLAMGTLYIKASSGNQAGLSSTSVGVAILQFVLVVLYHMYKKCENTRWMRRLKAFGHHKQQQAQENQMDYERLQAQPAMNHSRVRDLYHNYREPLLDLLDNQ